MVLRGWILLCTFVVASGWILSLFHALVAPVFGVILFISLIAAVALSWPGRAAAGQAWHKLVRRFAGRPPLLPAIFAFSVILLVVRALVYPPFHDDGLCYRIPRVMSWIMDHRLHWIEAQDERLNDRGVVSEWLTVPILMFFKTDRLVFLPNLVAHLLLPGAIFSFWRRLGLSPRIAWTSMWLLPTGLCFALQAVNSSNDSLASFFIVAAFALILKARQTRSWEDLALSLLSLALASGVKLNFLTLALPWAFLAFPLLRVCARRPLATAGLAATALLISFFPTAFLNIRHGGGFSGLRLEPAFILPPPLVALWGNLVLIFMQNVGCLPINHTTAFRFLEACLQVYGTDDLLDRYFAAPAHIYYNHWVAIEQAGIGYPVLAALALLRLMFLKTFHPAHPWAARLFFTFTIVALLQYLFLANTNQPARIIAPYYLLLAPVLFWRVSSPSLLLLRIGRVVAAIAMVWNLWLSLIWTENPIMEIQAFGNKTGYFRMYEDQVLIADVRQAFGANPKKIGLVRFWNQRESWLWQPYGTRQVIEISPQADSAQLRKFHLRYVVVSSEELADQHLTIDQWLARASGRLIGSGYADIGCWYFTVCADADGNYPPAPNNPR